MLMVMEHLTEAFLKLLAYEFVLINNKDSNVKIYTWPFFSPNYEVHQKFLLFLVCSPSLESGPFRRGKHHFGSGTTSKKTKKKSTSLWSKLCPTWSFIWIIPPPYSLKNPYLGFSFLNLQSLFSSFMLSLQINLNLIVVDFDQILMVLTFINIIAQQLSLDSGVVTRNG